MIRIKWLCSNLVFVLSLLFFSLLLACPQTEDNNQKENVVLIKNNIQFSNPNIPFIPPELPAVPSLPLYVKTDQLKLERERYAIDYYECDKHASRDGNKLILSATASSPGWVIYAIDKIDPKLPITLRTWKIKATGGAYYVGFSTYAQGGWTITGPFSVWSVGEFIPTERYTGPDGVAFLLVITPSVKTVVEGIEITTQTNPVIPVIKPIQRTIAWNQIDGYFEDNINDTWLREPVEIIDFTSKQSKPSGAMEIRYQVNQSNHYLFFAVEWPDIALNQLLTKDQNMSFDATSIFLCPANHTKPLENDDVRTLSPAFRTTYLDQHIDQSDNTADDLYMDGLGWCTYNPDQHIHRAEFVIPMIGDGQQDLNINPHNPQTVLVQMQFINNFRVLDKSNVGMNVAYLRAGEAKTTNAWIKIQPEPFNEVKPWQRLNGKLVFISDPLTNKGEIFKLDLPSGKLTQLTNNDLYENSVSLSPDGSWCTFSVAQAKEQLNSYEIARINLNGSDFKILTKNDKLDAHPAISPDGKTIAFVRYTRDNAADVFLIPANGGSARQLTDNEADLSEPAWFPDGKKIIVKSRETNENINKNPCDVLMIISIDSGQIIEQLTFEKDKANDHQPAFSPNGSQIAFSRFMLQKDWKQNFTEAPWQLFYLNVNDLNLQQVTDYLGINSQPIWANDNELLFIRSVGPGYAQIWLTTKNGLQQSEFLPKLPRIRSFDFKPTL